MATGVYPLGVSIAITVITALICLPLSALMLFFSAKLFKQLLGYGKALLPALVQAIISIIFGIINALVLSSVSGNVLTTVSTSVMLGILSFTISLALYLILPKLVLGYDWPTSLKVGAVWFGFMLLVGLVIGIIIGMIAAVVFMAGAASTLSAAPVA